MSNNTVIEMAKYKMEVSIFSATNHQGIVEAIITYIGDCFHKNINVRYHGSFIRYHIDWMADSINVCVDCDGVQFINCNPRTDDDGKTDDDGETRESIMLTFGGRVYGHVIEKHIYEFQRGLNKAYTKLVFDALFKTLDNIGIIEFKNSDEV